MRDGLFDVTGRIVLITGSSRGLGLAMARGLGRAGAHPVLNGRDEKRLTEAVESLRRDGLAADGYAFDVRTSELESIVAAIEADLGAIDVLINNAGINLRGPLEQIDDATWQSVLDVNLTGAFRMARAVVKGMIRRRRGKIINICSLMSEASRPTTGPYTASKGGLKLLTKAMALEWGPHNIQVNAIGPGYFLTEMTRPLAADEQFDAWVKAKTPAGRWGQPDDLLGTVQFLASRASDFVNGQIIHVDGGWLAGL